MHRDFEVSDVLPSLSHTVGLFALYGPPYPQVARTTWRLVRIAHGVANGGHTPFPEPNDGLWICLGPVAVPKARNMSCLSPGNWIEASCKLLGAKSHLQHIFFLKAQRGTRGNQLGKDA